MRINPIGRLVVMAVVVPVAARALRKMGQSMQSRQGGSRMGGALQKTASGLDFVSGRRHAHS